MICKPGHIKQIISTQKTQTQVNLSKTDKASSYLHVEHAEGECSVWLLWCLLPSATLCSSLICEGGEVNLITFKDKMYAFVLMHDTSWAKGVLAANNYDYEETKVKSIWKTIYTGWKNKEDSTTSTLTRHLRLHIRNKEILLSVQIPHFIEQ